MKDKSILEKHGLTPEKLKSLFQDPKEGSKPHKLVKLISSRIQEGISRNLEDYRQWWAADLAYDVTLRQMTPTLARSLIDTKKSSQDVMKAVEDWGLTHMLQETTSADGKKCKALDLPSLFEIFFPLVKAILTVRWGRIFNDRNQVPFFQYAPSIFSLHDTARAEILTSRVQQISTQYGFPSVFRQALFKQLHYGICLQFPTEEWHEEFQLRKGASKKEEEFTVREGLRYALPHPSRTYFDGAYRIGTTNADTGVSYAGYWALVRFRDVDGNDHYWNKDKVPVGNVDIFTRFPTYFRTVYPCNMKFPECTNRQAASDRESTIGYFSSEQDDQAVLLTYHFQKLIPKDWGLGDYKYPVWMRFILANYDTVIWSAPVCYNPLIYYGYDANEDSARNIGISLEVLPFQDHISNLLTQQIISIKQNLTNLVFYDQTRVEQKYIDLIENSGEKFFRQLNMVPFSRRKGVFEQTDIEKQFYTVRFPVLSTAEIVTGIRTLLDILERLLVMSSQELAQAATHEQTAQEVKTIENTTSTRLEFTASFTDDALWAWQKQIYDALMAYGADDVFAQMDTSDPAVKKAIKDLGFTVVEEGDNQRKSKIKGPKTALVLESFIANRGSTNRANYPGVAAAMAQIAGSMLNNPLVAQALGPQQAIDLYNDIWKLAGMPKDRKLRALAPTEQPKPPEGQSPQQGPSPEAAAIVDQVKQQLLQLAQATQQQIQQQVKPLQDGIIQVAQKLTADEQQMVEMASVVKSLSEKFDALMALASQSPPAPPPPTQYDASVIGPTIPAGSPAGPPVSVPPGMGNPPQMY